MKEVVVDVVNDEWLKVLEGGYWDSERYLVGSFLFVGFSGGFVFFFVKFVGDGIVSSVEIVEGVNWMLSNEGRRERCLLSVGVSIGVFGDFFVGCFGSFRGGSVDFVSDEVVGVFDGFYFDSCRWWKLFVWVWKLFVECSGWLFVRVVWWWKKKNSFERWKMGDYIYNWWGVWFVCKFLVWLIFWKVLEGCDGGEVFMM